MITPVKFKHGEIQQIASRLGVPYDYVWRYAKLGVSTESRESFMAGAKRIASDNKRSVGTKRRGVLTGIKHKIAAEFGWTHYKAWYWIYEKGAPHNSVEAFKEWFSVNGKTLSEKAEIACIAKYGSRSNYVKQREARKRKLIRENPIRMTKHLAMRRRWYSKQDSGHKLIKALRRRVYKLVTASGLMKCGKTTELVGCNMDALREYLQRQFVCGMTWENYGSAWHIDHVIPCSHFDMSNPQHQRTCFNWQNLRPLWAAENCSRGNKLEGQTQIYLPITA